METTEEFVQKHRPRLLRYLDGNLDRNDKKTKPLDFVDQVLTDWTSWSAGRELAEPDDLERTFWFTLYQFEEVVENAAFSHDPYYAVLMDNLKMAREQLRVCGILPAGLFATRPGEYSYDDDDEEFPDGMFPEIPISEEIEGS